MREPLHSLRSEEDFTAETDKSLTPRRRRITTERCSLLENQILIVLNKSNKHGVNKDKASFISYFM
jgi:hypothetical protein